MTYQLTFPKRGNLYRILPTLLLLGVCAQVPVTAASTSTVPRNDTSFLKEAAEGGMQEVKLGDLAQRKGMNESVKAFGRRMVADHTRLNGEVQAFSSKRGVELPTDTGLKAKASYKLLEARSGESFDKAYISSMVKDHEEDVAAFEKEANSGEDAGTKALAAKALPTLREHLRMAREIAQKLGAVK